MLGEDPAVLLEDALDPCEALLDFDHPRLERNMVLKQSGLILKKSRHCLFQPPVSLFSRSRHTFSL
jgi:hypothetical protein